MGKIETAISNIPDVLLEEALEADSAEKLKKAKRFGNAKLRAKAVRYISALAACLCLCVCAAYIHQHLLSATGGRLEVASPITQVDSAEEMGKYLGFDVPVLSDKNAASYTVYAYEKYAYRGEITYSDGSVFCAERGNGDISGIYGGALQGTQTVSRVTVYFYSMENIRYAIWSSNGLSYCYCASPYETDYSKQIAELISAIK